MNLELLNMENFLSEWWTQFRTQEVTSNDLLPIAMQDHRFRKYCNESYKGDKYEQSSRSKIGTELYNKARKKEPVAGFTIHHKPRSSQPDGVSRFSIERLQKLSRLAPKRETNSSPEDSESNNAPFGYRIHPEEHKTLTRIKTLDQIGFSQESIVEGLNIDDLNRRGQPWTEKTVHECLSNIPVETVEIVPFSFTYNKTIYLFKVVGFACMFSIDGGLSWKKVNDMQKILALELDAPVKAWLYVCVLQRQQLSNVQFVGLMDGFLSKMTQ